MMNTFQTLRHTFISAAVLFFLCLGTGMTRGADEAVSENFDSFPTGGFTTLATALGTMTAESGHAAIADNRYSSLPNCMRLTGQGHRNQKHSHTDVAFPPDGQKNSFPDGGTLDAR